MDQLVTIIINNGIGVGCAVAILWFAWFRETRTIPMLVSTFDKAIAAFNESQAKGVESLFTMQKQSQDSFSERTDKTLEVFSTLVREERANYERWHAENRGLLIAIREDIKENRHSIKDVANVIGLRKALEDYEQAHKMPPKTGPGYDPHETAT